MTKQKIKLCVCIQQLSTNKEEWFIRYVIPTPDNLQLFKYEPAIVKFIDCEVELDLPEDVLKVVE